MADLWQAYSGWVLYAAFFAVFIWLHLRMHGGGGHGAGHGCGHAGHGHTGSRESGHHHGPAQAGDEDPSVRKTG